MTQKKAPPKMSDLHPDTRLLHTGRDPEANAGAVNPAVYRASTIVYPTVADYHESDKTKFDGPVGRGYALHGTPTTFALEEAIANLEGGTRCVVTGSGLTAITGALIALLGAGDHLLMVDTVYGPARMFLERVLKRYGVDITYYDPLIGGDIAALMKPQTKVVYTESPGSLTFEVQNIPAIASAAHAGGAILMMDNTYGAGVLFKAFEHGVDVSVHAISKYVNGHADVMMGSITTVDEDLFKTIRRCVADLGLHTAPDTCYLALRGLRTLSVRLERHQETALKLAHWFSKRDEVETVLHPAFESCPGHSIWERDFTGSNGLFSIVLGPVSDTAVAAMLDGLDLFAIGESWGGYESLVLPVRPGRIRTATTWSGKGPVIRFHAGLEDSDDLIADLEKGFQRLNA